MAMTTNWRAALGAWRSWLQASDRTPLSIRLRSHQLTRFAAAHPDGYDVDVDELAAWLAHPGWSTETRRSTRSALRCFYRWTYATGRLPSDPAAHLPAIKPAIHLPRPAPEEIVRNAVAIPDRVGVMLTLAARQGLRRGEIACVHSDDLVRDLGGWSLRVHGKGRKDRTVPLADDVAAALIARGPGYIFPSLGRGHLSADYVGKLMSQALPHGWTAHTLRHRFATVSYAGTRDLLAVQELLGHSRPETTRGYIQMPQDSLRAAVAAAA